MSEYRLEMCDVVKTFPGVKALNHAQLKLKPGTVHALMGENGAGKSTLMKCMFGIYHMDEGKVIYEGQEVQIKGPLDALNRGIAMVHQELQPIPERSIGENIYVGRYPTKKYGPVTVIDHDKMYEDAAKVLKEVHLNYDPHAKLGTLSVSQMQLVEIAKAVSADCKVLILDEPTSSLTAAEVEALFTIVNELRAKGVSIVYISHKMDEILRISDEVTIMRDGQYIGTWEAKELTTDMIITKMVGRELSNLYPPRSNTPGEVVFEVKDFTSINPKSFRHVNFNVRKGEILGVAGLVGAQRTELMEGLFGLRCHTSGTITYKGKELTINQPQDAIKNGIAMLTEDRRATGILGVLSIADNVSIASLNKYLIGGIMLVLGSLSCLGYGPLANVTIIGMQFLDFFDFLTNSVMMPIAAIATCLLVSRVIGMKRIEEEVLHGEGKFHRKRIFQIMVQYLCPVFAVIILISSVANAFGWISM